MISVNRRSNNSKSSCLVNITPSLFSLFYPLLLSCNYPLSPIQKSRHLLSETRNMLQHHVARSNRHKIRETKIILMETEENCCRKLEEHAGAKSIRLKLTSVRHIDSIPISRIVHWPFCSPIDAEVAFKSLI